MSLRIIYRSTEVLLPPWRERWAPPEHHSRMRWDAAHVVFVAFDGCGSWGRGATVDEAKAVARRVRGKRAGRARWTFMRIDGDPQPTVDLFGYIITHRNARIVDVDSKGVPRAARR